MKFDKVFKLTRSWLRGRAALTLCLSSKFKSLSKLTTENTGIKGSRKQEEKTSHAKKEAPPKVVTK